MQTTPFPKVTGVAKGKRSPSFSRASCHSTAVLEWPTSVLSSDRRQSQHERFFADAYKAPLIDLVETVRQGIPAEVIAQLAEHSMRLANPS